MQATGNRQDMQCNLQQQREYGEPHEGYGAVPWFVTSIVAGLLVFGVVYIVRAPINSMPPARGDARVLAELQTPPKVAGAAVDGAAVYTARCASCHQATGAGVPGVFPPLAGSEWVQGKDSTLAAIVLHGVSGPLTVKGVTYNGAMPAFGGQLQDAELAAVLTHIRSQWGNAGTPVKGDVVAEIRESSAARKQPFKGDAELAPMK